MKTCDFNLIRINHGEEGGDLNYTFLLLIVGRELVGRLVGRELVGRLVGRELDGLLLGELVGNLEGRELVVG